MAAPAFSRLQLAAALLEYDNDPDDPDSPQVNAKESAIFASLRRPAPPPRVLQQQPDDDEDEDVPLSHAAHIRNVDVRKSMVASLVNVEPEDLERAADDEMLSSWGLDGLVEKAEEKKDKRPAQLNLDKDKLASLGIDDTREPPSRALSVMLPNPHGPPTPTDVNMSPIHRYPPKRPLSMGDMDGLVIGVSPERRRNPPEAIDYRQSMAGTLDFAAPAPANPGPGEVALTTPELLVFPAKDAPQSSPGDGSPNPFAIPLPETTRRSRFDPKALSEERRLSIGSMGQLQRPEDPEDQAAQDASTDYLGSNLPNSRARAHSMGTMQTQAMLDADEPTPLPSPAAPEAKRLTRLDLLRPKVLVMPSPLQDKKADSKKTRDGFFTTDDGGFPLPIGSRPEARPGLAPLAGSVSNPRLSMSLSQLTFRQSLMVGGQRDPSYFDIDKNLRTAAEEGERADQGWSEEEDEDKELRPAGKLYGKSLIDNLEARKAVIKGKQRVFTGDQRSAMMQRPGMTRSSTLIDASTFGNSRPATQYLSPSQVQEDARRKRASGAPLVDFSSEVPPGPNSRPGMPASRSVFGVDKVWERELAKLKALEEQEKEEQGKMKALDARLDDKRQQAAMTRSTSANLDQRASALLPDSLMPTPPLGGADSDEERRPPLGSRRESAASLGARGWFNSPGSDDETEEDKRASFVSTNTMRPPAFSRKISAGNKLPQIPSGGDDSEEEDIPLAQQAARRSMMPPRQTSKSFAPVDSDSDEDKPIAVLKRHQSKSSAGPSGLSKIGLGNDGPFSAELGLGASAFSPGKGNTAAKGGDDSSEDEVPLGVRHPTANRLSSMPTKAESDEDEDDKPLGAKFAASNAFQQQQAMQQQALLQQQMMQQQMMMQQAMRTSMFGGSMMNPSVMGSGFFPAPMSMHSMNVNALAVAQEAQTAQLSRVDQWRRDVVQ